MLPDASGAFFCISCSRCQVNKCGFCDLCSSSPRCLNDSEAPLHMRVCEYVSLMMEGEKESLYLFYFSPSSLFNLLSFRKFHTEECCVAPGSVLPLFSPWLTGCSSAVSQTEHLQKGSAGGPGSRLIMHFCRENREDLTHTMCFVSQVTSSNSQS